ncbi:integral membrane protein, DUF1295 family protein [Pseudohyphozyma bogoriensis]|nr:integral membrane protein, DUF1295 family protein [Pseudohyphozyma bogoriensis]
MHIFKSKVPLIPAAPPPFFPSYSLKPGLASFTSNLPASYSIEGLKAWYLAADPLHPSLLMATFLSALVWVLSEITGNCSQVDRLWTFLPLIYGAHYTFHPLVTGAGQLDDRMLLLFGLQCLWSLRLTTNTYRRGFFNPKSEDYRWEIVRGRIPVWAFKILNLTFISIIQNFLFIFSELPVYLLLTHSQSHPRTPLNFGDYGLAALFVLTLVVEMMADNQQQKYQNWKAKAKESKVLTPFEAGRLKRGFVTEGLWSWSRHPNFACEQFTWYILYAFTVIPFLPSSLTWTSFRHHASSVDSLASLATLLRKYEGTLWNYSIWSPLTMSLLFMASTNLTEEISAGKYPLYKSYQKRVPEFWPPLAALKIVWLFVSRQKKKVENDVWGTAGEKNKVQ